VPGVHNAAGPEKLMAERAIEMEEKPV